MSETMLGIKMQDLIIRLDEQRDVLQFLVPKKTDKVGGLRIFYEVPASKIPSTEDVENHIGTTILAFLSATYSAKSFRLDKYRQAGRSFDQLMTDEIAQSLDSEDIDDEFEGAMLHLNRFDETWSLKDVDDMTALLMRLAESGSEKAAQFLRDDWLTRSEILKKRLDRNTDR